MKGKCEMLTAEQYLHLVNQRGVAGKTLTRVYANMLKNDLFVNAYGKLYANQGALTPGVDGETVDGTSVAKLEKLLDELKTRRFKWTPVRRTHISKKDKHKKRPLGIPTWKDKVVQEVIRVILEAYYEPQFSEQSHGFRPGRGCHTALKEIYFNWKGTKWFIEGDIKGCFDNIDHDLLIQIIGRKIQDQSFLKLLKAMLNAGYLENWQYHKTYSGTPQGNIASPILANIYLNELDTFIKEMIPEYTKGTTRSRSKAAMAAYARMRQAEKRGDKKLAQELREQFKKMPIVETNDPNYRRLKYVRYADDFLLGFVGPIKEAKEIKERLKEFLTNHLKLDLSEDKTYLTQASREPARFLGFDISCPPEYRRGIKLELPRDKVVEWKRKYSKNGKPSARPALLYLSDYEIIRQYGAELRGFYHYYNNAVNVAKQIQSIKWVMMQSLVRTLANKHKIHMTEVYRRYKSKEETDSITVTIEGKTATFGGFSLRRKKSFAYIEDKITFIYYGRNELVRRLLTDECEIEGCQNDAVEGHHIKALKNLKRRWQGKNNAPKWVKFMIARNRKVIMVCREHHQQIHSGLYDGPKLG